MSDRRNLPDLEPGRPGQARLSWRWLRRKQGVRARALGRLGDGNHRFRERLRRFGPDYRCRYGSGGQATTTFSPDDGRAPGCEAKSEEDVGSGSAILGEAAPEGYEVIDQQAQTVPPGGTASFPVSFDGTSAALMWILPGGDGISATMEGAEFSREDVLGAPSVVAAITSPHDGDLVVRNDTGQAEDIGVIVFGLTARRLTIDASPRDVTPNGEVAVTVRLGEATAADSPCAVVRRDGEVVTTLVLQPNGVGIWQSSFRPPTIGDYAVQAAVGGDRPRHSVLALVTVRPRFGRSRPPPYRHRTGTDGGRSPPTGCAAIALLLDPPARAPAGVIPGQRQPRSSMQAFPAGVSDSR